MLQLIVKGMDTSENYYKNRSHFFQFYSYSVSFGKGVAQIMLLNRADLNIRKMHRKGYLRTILQLGMRSLSFLRKSQVYTNRNEHVLNIFVPTQLHINDSTDP